MVNAVLDCAGKPLDLTRPQVMGILNITPDSFSDGGDFFPPAIALEHARRMVEEGAAIIDVGGESTRPGAQAVSESEELARVVPVIQAISRELSVPVSIDTSKPAVMRAAVAAGAGLINDVMGLRLPGALEAASELGVPVCLMHMQGEPRTMQEAPAYDDVVVEIKAFFAERIAACVAAGIRREWLLLDPGFGFGKSLEHNLTLLGRLQEFTDLAVPLLVGVSRKSMFGALLNAPVDQRLHASLAAAVMALSQGASIIRAHDVRATVDALVVTAAIMAHQNR
jgi:dihydropteroate synthase